jgi:DNA-binding winged helix-turn-helix (wHTH) protein
VRLDFADVAIDTRSREIHRAGKPVHLSPKAFELLLILIESRPQAVAKRALQDRLWPDTFVVEKNLTNLVAEIRKAIGDSSASPTFLRTVSRFGYALRDRPDAGPTAPAARSAGDTEVHLTWTLGRATLREGEHIVGRAADAAICLEADSVSRRHARIVVTGTAATVEDLGSKNGTTIGDRRVRGETALVDGDRLRIGSVVLEVRFAGPVESTRTVSRRASASSRAGS